MAQSLRARSGCSSLSLVASAVTKPYRSLADALARRARHCQRSQLADDRNTPSGAASRRTRPRPRPRPYGRGGDRRGSILGHVLPWSARQRVTSARNSQLPCILPLARIGCETRNGVEVLGGGSPVGAGVPCLCPVQPGLTVKNPKSKISTKRDPSVTRWSPAVRCAL